MYSFIHVVIRTVILTNILEGRKNESNVETFQLLEDLPNITETLSSLNYLPIIPTTYRVLGDFSYRSTFVFPSSTLEASRHLQPVSNPGPGGHRIGQRAGGYCRRGGSSPRSHRRRGCPRAREHCQRGPPGTRSHRRRHRADPGCDRKRGSNHRIGDRCDPRSRGQWDPANADGHRERRQHHRRNHSGLENKASQTKSLISHATHA